MMTAPRADPVPCEGLEIRVRGTVQGVGFRPTVWRIARECDIAGQVVNDGAGVLIHAFGDTAATREFLERLQAEPPPLSRIVSIETRPLAPQSAPEGFVIADSVAGEVRTHVPADAAVCQACRNEVLDPDERRFRYPFTNCTHCGPRFSVVEAVPYDRARTTMAAFELCGDCTAEYGAPGDRRFHAQPIACHICGPRAWLVRLDGGASPAALNGAADDVEAAANLVKSGAIVAIKGLGGFHLACDASNEEAVKRLRARKRRVGKPFALMAREVGVVRRFCSVSTEEAQLLECSEAPIVVLSADGPEQLPAEVAPGFDTLGFMLPYTPLHLLLLERIDGPVIMTSGNIADEPQAIDNSDAFARLASIAEYALMHDRDIANRIDDSVVRVMAGKPRLLRRARGYAPGAVALPDGFAGAPNVLAYGGELKATFCVVRDGTALLSQHQGDLENADTFDDYQKNLGLYEALFDCDPAVLAADMHPDYLSAKLARERAVRTGVPLLEIQHHHAHIAGCMAENDVALNDGPVLGVALDGLGFGDDGAIWGGEFMLADYSEYRRLGRFKPVAMPGGAQAIRQPWRNTYAHLSTAMGWPNFAEGYGDLELATFLSRQPLDTLEGMMQRGINSPPASSCGRLFDAVAAAVGLARRHARFEGEGACHLEAVVDHGVMEAESDEKAYRFAVGNPGDGEIACIDPSEMWHGLLEDLGRDTPVPVIAARFHKGLAGAICAMVCELTGCLPDETPARRVALTGGCFQNKVLLEETQRRLLKWNFEVLTHTQVPANDGGLAFGQAAIAAARSIKQEGTFDVTRGLGRNP